MKKGFTLIELMVVIVIIGVIAAAALPKILGEGSQFRPEMIDGHTVKVIGDCKYVNINGQWVIYKEASNESGN